MYPRLLGLIGLSLAVIMLGEQYALYGLATAPGSLPAARLAGCRSGWVGRTLTSDPDTDYAPDRAPGRSSGAVLACADGKTGARPPAS